MVGIIAGSISAAISIGKSIYNMVQGNKQAKQREQQLIDRLNRESIEMKHMYQNELQNNTFAETNFLLDIQNLTLQTRDAMVQATSQIHQQSARAFNEDAIGYLQQNKQADAAGTLAAKSAILSSGFMSAQNRMRVGLFQNRVMLEKARYENQFAQERQANAHELGKQQFWADFAPQLAQGLSDITGYGMSLSNIIAESLPAPKGNVQKTASDTTISTFDELPMPPEDTIVMSQPSGSNTMNAGKINTVTTSPIQ